MALRPLRLSLATLLIGCSTSPQTPTGQAEVRPECGPRERCFEQRAVRDIRVLDDKTLIVFVGRSRCPFRVTVDGFFCNLRMTSTFGFRDADGRICRLDRSYVVSDPFARGEDNCQIRDVESLNDDELLEAYAAFGIIQPLPPTGSGEIEVIEEAPPDETPAERMEPIDEATDPVTTTALQPL
jgi:hypothetical protein